MNLTSRQIDYCMECGVCTGSCPVSYELPSFSPRQIIKRATMAPESEWLQSVGIWACLSCARCSTRCPVEIDFPEFIRSIRNRARDAGYLPQENHHGIFQTISGIHTGDITQNRIKWAEDAGRFVQKGDYFYFVGCLPYFDVVFRYLNVSPVESARAVLSLLNKVGIEPVISNDERCCGHDALWSGDEEKFRKLARRNIDVIRESGAKVVLTACPEGYTVLKNDYPKYFGHLPFDVVHISEFLADELEKIECSIKSDQNGLVTYHDPCRLGRGSGIYGAPRRLIRMVSDTNLVEMEHSGPNALCCGTSAWMSCSSISKAMQTERLNEALAAGAKTLITSCPKCWIHLTCALNDTQFDLQITDIYKFVSERLK